MAVPQEQVSIRRAFGRRGNTIRIRRKYSITDMSYCGTVITVPYDISPYYISNNEKRRTFYGASLSYYWEFLTVMNRASTNLVVSGFRKE